MPERPVYAMDAQGVRSIVGCIVAERIEDGDDPIFPYWRITDIKLSPEFMGQISPNDEWAGKIDESGIITLREPFTRNLYLPQLAPEP